MFSWIYDEIAGLLMLWLGQAEQVSKRKQRAREEAFAEQVKKELANKVKK